MYSNFGVKHSFLKYLEGLGQISKGKYIYIYIKINVDILKTPHRGGLDGVLNDTKWGFHHKN